MDQVWPRAETTRKYVLPRSHVTDAPMDMSFSGLKTAALNLIHNAGQQKVEELDLPSFAASFAAAISDTLDALALTMAATQLKGIRQDRRRRRCGSQFPYPQRPESHAVTGSAGYQLYLPELKLCGDNGAMIGCQGFYEYQAGVRGALDQNGFANMDIGKYF